MTLKPLFKTLGAIALAVSAAAGAFAATVSETCNVYVKSPVQAYLYGFVRYTWWDNGQEQHSDVPMHNWPGTEMKLMGEDNYYMYYKWTGGARSNPDNIPENIIFSSESVQSGTLRYIDGEVYFNYLSTNNNYGTQPPVELSTTNFPDDNFRGYLSNVFDQNNDGWITWQEFWEPSVYGYGGYNRITLWGGTMVFSRCKA